MDANDLKAKGFSDEELKTMRGKANAWGPFKPSLSDRRFLDTIAADRKRIEEQLMAMSAMNEKAEEQAATIERLRGALEPFMKLKCTAIASEGRELRITFNTPIAGGTSIKNWNDKLEQARQALGKE